VQVHLVPIGAVPRRVELHAQSRALLVADGDRGLSRSVWLHELGHVSAAGARPEGRVGRRLLAAVDEAFADYYAAVLGASPRVGDGGEARDLERPPPATVTAWAELALAVTGYDPHRLGHGLAARLWAAEPMRHELLRDLQTALASERRYDGVPDTPAALLEELSLRVPARSRARFERAIAGWAPHEIVPDRMRVAHGR
jgi:hypothetical protein